MKKDKFQNESLVYGKTTNFGLVPDKEYRLTGRGNLGMINSGKTGIGFCIEWEEIITKDIPEKTWKVEKKMLFFTVEEMYDNFLTREEYDIPYYRDLKLQQILNGNN